MNKIILIGRLTRDPELRYAANSGTPVTRFTLAVNRPKIKDQEQKADFITCVAFGKTAEAIAQYIPKGRKIAIEGSIRTGNYEKDGSKRYATEIYIDKFYFIESRGHEESTVTAPEGYNPPDMEMVENMDDIPF